MSNAKKGALIGVIGIGLVGAGYVVVDEYAYFGVAHMPPPQLQSENNHTEKLSRENNNIALNQNEDQFIKKELPISQPEVILTSEEVAFVEEKLKTETLRAKILNMKLKLEAEELKLKIKQNEKEMMEIINIMNNETPTSFVRVEDIKIEELESPQEEFFLPEMPKIDVKMISKDSNGFSGLVETDGQLRKIRIGDQIDDFHSIKSMTTTSIILKRSIDGLETSISQIKFASENEEEKVEKNKKFENKIELPFS